MAKKWVIGLVLVLVLGISPAAMGAEGSGVIRITMSCSGEAVPGGEVVVYPAGRYGNDGIPVLTDEFSGAAVSLSKVNSPETAWILADYAEKRGITGIRTPVDSTGNAVISGLEPGIYLVTQSRAAEGFLPFVPFLVALNGDNGCNLHAYPKVEPEESPTEPDDTSSPQTGQKNRMQLRLAFWGLVVSGSGILFCLLRRKRK